jgi:zinc/manganese transport system substrate-binding protein
VNKYIFVLFYVFSIPAFAKLNVVTSTTTLKSLVDAVGGDLVEVTSITQGPQDPHFVEPKPS